MEKKHDKLVHRPYEYADIAYRYAQLCANDGIYLRDYGIGELYTAVEVHTVTLIEDNPGITATEIAERTNRTKGAVSQILSKLEEKGLIRKEVKSTHGRRSHLYVTPLGLELSMKHKDYDDQYMGDHLEEWISLFGYDAVESYFKIMEYYINNYASNLEKTANEKGDLPTIRNRKKNDPSTY